MSDKAYKESKICQSCGRNFSVQSRHGNPYRTCPACRAAKNDEFQKVIKEIKKK
jgi:hypothetical protein